VSRVTNEGSVEAKRRTPAWLRGLQAVALSIVVFLFGLLAWKLVTEDEGRNLISAVNAGRAPAAPPFELPVISTADDTWPGTARPALGDGWVALAELAGHAIVLNFWASWCIPCKEEAPLLAASARNNRGHVLFLGIDVQDLTSDARRFLRKTKANYPSVRDGPGGTYSRFGLTGVPETYYLDARHRIVAHTVGQVSRDELQTGVATAIRGVGS
jgi:cytochrome c biogenesis protein CcmG/thiol:disulfide interchange protein DsbE